MLPILCLRYFVYCAPEGPYFIVIKIDALLTHVRSEAATGAKFARATRATADLPDHARTAISGTRARPLYTLLTISWDNPTKKQHYLPRKLPQNLNNK